MLLLQPQFKQSEAWQYSSSNLLRVASFGRRRFKPVVKPEALLRPPEVTLKQLAAHSVTPTTHGSHTNGQVQVQVRDRERRWLSMVLAWGSASWTAHMLGRSQRHGG